MLQVNIKSLEDVVRKYLALASDKTDSAKKESHQVVIDVEDLDVLQTPEKLVFYSSQYSLNVLEIICRYARRN